MGIVYRSQTEAKTVPTVVYKPLLAADQSGHWAPFAVAASLSAKVQANELDELWKSSIVHGYFPFSRAPTSQDAAAAFPHTTRLLADVHSEQQ